MLFESSRFELREFYNMSIHTSSSSGIACAIAATRSAKGALQTCETNAFADVHAHPWELDEAASPQRRRGLDQERDELARLDGALRALR